MDLNKTLQDLYSEKEKIDRAIASLECLHKADLGDAPTAQRPNRRGRHAMSARERLEVSERMRHYWAARREDAGKVSEKPLTRTAGAS
ncbi:MAG: hypothetical protein ACLPX8_11025 [Bryobacteraceae bacterium]|jgi:hypothetical protein